MSTAIAMCLNFPNWSTDQGGLPCTLSAAFHRIITSHSAVHRYGIRSKDKCREYSVERHHTGRLLIGHFRHEVKNNTLFPNSQFLDLGRMKGIGTGTQKWLSGCRLMALDWSNSAYDRKMQERDFILTPQIWESDTPRFALERLQETNFFRLSLQSTMHGPCRSEDPRFRQLVPLPRFDLHGGGRKAKPSSKQFRTCAGMQ